MADAHGSDSLGPSLSAVPSIRRTKSEPPSALCGAIRVDAEGQRGPLGDEAEVLFDMCRFPRPATDLLEFVVGQEPWQEARTLQGEDVHIVGEAAALKNLFSLPLQSAGEVVCLHRIGDCLVVLSPPEEEEDVFDAHTHRETVDVLPTHKPRVSTSPRSLTSTRCQVTLEGNMVRIYPRIAPAEPVEVDPPPSLRQPIAACCEWQVREGLSLLAVTPAPSMPADASCDAGPCLTDLRHTPPRLFADSSYTGVLHNLRTWRPALPAYHRRVIEGLVAVLVVDIEDEDAVEASTLIDSWLSCCILGSPSLLCFFVDADGNCRGCRFVAAADIPFMRDVVKSFRPERKFLADAAGVMGEATGADAPSGEASAKAFDPGALKEVSHALLDRLLERCGHDGGHCMVVAGLLGLNLFGSPVVGSDDEELDELEPRAEGPTENGTCSDVSFTLALRPEVQTWTATHPLAVGHARTATGRPSLLDRFQRGHVTQALLMYHAAVRLAQARQPAKGSTAPGAVKGVPIGARWTAKSCRHPLRVRQMMLRAVRALQAATTVDHQNIQPSPLKEEQAPPRSDSGTTAARPLKSKYVLLFASASEFIGDSFLAEDSHDDEALDVPRYLSALRHLRNSSKYLAEYASSVEEPASDGEDFAQSVKRLQERVVAKRANAHLCLARIRQRQLWREGDASLRTVGAAMRELDEAEELFAKPAGAGQPPRQCQHGPHESSVLASIAKWKADLLLELTTLCASIGSAAAGDASAAEVDARVREYLEAQQREMGEAPQPIPLQHERWLQLIISLCLRSLHHLASVPSELSGDLQLQARALLARAYGDLGHVFASTGRFTKAMTHAKQGIELFTATKDQVHAAALQLWLSRLQLRLALPQAASACLDAHGDGLEVALLQGLSAGGGPEDAVCSQVVAALQRALRSLDTSAVADQALQRDGHALLGTVLLRQGLTRLARCPAPLCAVCRLCEEDSSLSSTLGILQALENCSTELAREAAEMMIQACSCFQNGANAALDGMAHACLAAVYFCSRQDPRMQRLVVTHCQHALEQFAKIANTFANERRGHATTYSLASLVRLAVQLFEAKTSRRAGAGGKAPRGGEARSASALCSITLRCCEGHTAPGDAGDEAAGAGFKIPMEQRSPLKAYLRQELNDILLRLLRASELHDEVKKDLKASYCALLTAWHADAGQVEALESMRDMLDASFAT